jgi:hypothetical protein
VLDTHAIAELAAETQFVAGTHPRGGLPHRNAVDCRAVLAAEVGNIDGAVLRENPRMTA